MEQEFDLFAVLPQGLEDVGSIELVDLGAKQVRKSRGILRCKVDLVCFYRLHLQARLPFRFLRVINYFMCDGRESLYKAVQNSCDWQRWLDPSKSFRVDVSGSSRDLTHTHFTALTVKNAVVDLQQRVWGRRSVVNLESPNMCLHLHLFHGNGILSFSTSSKSLHRRGYRSAMGIAPLKENLAAGLIKLSNWTDKLTLVDPLCGSGTFLLEAASIGLGISPGLYKSYLFENWPDFDKELWLHEKNHAKQMFSPNKKLPELIGCEENLEIANQAKDNIKKAGLDNFIKIRIGDFKSLIFPELPGVIVCNPPYGRRLGILKDLELMYQELGNYLKTNASGWDFWLLNGNSKLSNFLGMKCSRRFPISNGGIDCRWLHYKIH